MSGSQRAVEIVEGDVMREGGRAQIMEGLTYGCYYTCDEKGEHLKQVDLIYT